MSVPDFSTAERTPNPSAVFVTALIIQCLYRGDRASVDAIAARLGGRVVYWIWDRSTFANDVAIIQVASDYLIAFAGTTNLDQWIAHARSGVWPASDSQTGTSVVASFFEGEQITEVEIRRVIGDSPGRRLHICGHSYGAGAAHIFAVHELLRRPGPEVCRLITFGEPASYPSASIGATVVPHYSIAAGTDLLLDRSSPSGVDPVCLTPPPSDITGANSFAVRVGATTLTTDWLARGERWELTDTQMVRVHWFGSAITRTHAVRTVELLANTPFFAQHYMGPSYLTKAMALFNRSVSGISNIGRLLPIASTALVQVAATNQTIIGETTMEESVGWPNNVPGNAIRDAISTCYDLGAINARQRNSILNLLNGGETVGPANFMTLLITRNNAGTLNTWNGWTNPRLSAQVIGVIQAAADTPQPDVPEVQIGLSPSQPPVNQREATVANTVTALQQNPAPLTTNQQRSATIIAAVNDGARTVSAPVVPADPEADKLPPAFLSFVERVGKEAFVVNLAGRTMMNFRTRGGANKYSKTLNKVIQDSGKSAGFNISDFAGGIEVAFREASGEIGQAQGLTVPLPGF